MCVILCLFGALSRRVGALQISIIIIIIDQPFSRVAVDIIGPITPASKDGNRYILTMVDHATHYPEAMALKTIKAMTCHSAVALVEMWSRLGIPAEVLTDRGTQFTSDVMRYINRLLSINHHCTTPYHFGIRSTPVLPQ